MICGTYERTPEIITKWKNSYLGNNHIPWNKGLKLSQKIRNKISEATRKAMLDPKIREKISISRSGRLLSEIHKKAISSGVKGKQAGDKHYNWKGGKKNWLWIDEIYKSVEYNDWRIKVFIRDNFTCVLCKEKNKRIQADHIAPKCLYPELMFSIDNGRTLCEDCHKQTPTYGINKKYMLTKQKCQPH